MFFFEKFTLFNIAFNKICSNYLKINFNLKKYKIIGKFCFNINAKSS
jgi:hypothetical protein